MNAREIEARRWFRQSASDMAVVRILAGEEHYDAACFYAQQAAEKSLKSVLYSQGHRIVIGHSIRDLAQQCLTYDASFGTLSADASLLDQFYIPTRYPNGLPSPSVPSETYAEADARSAEDAANRINTTVEAFLRSNTGAL